MKHILLILSLIILSLNNIANAKCTVDMQNAAKQGDTVIINIKSDDELINPTFNFNQSKNIQLYKIGEHHYRGLLGIDGMQKINTYSVYLSDESKNLNNTKKITVNSGNYKNQYITLSKKKSSLKLTKNELNKIRKAKSYNTNVAYFSEPPYKMPTEGCLSSLYGLRRYYNGVASGSYHKGLDIATDKGTTINAFTNGKVVLAQMLNYHGGTVFIDHGQGVLSAYLHMSRIDVNKGDIVKIGQKIGEVGSTGISTGPHLHFGLYINKTAVDPSKYWGNAPMICKD